MNNKLSSVAVLLIACCIVFLTYISLQKQQLAPNKKITAARQHIDCLKTKNRKIDMQLDEVDKHADSLKIALENGKQKMALLNDKKHKKIIRIKSATTLELFEFFSGYETEDTTNFR